MAPSGMRMRIGSSPLESDIFLGIVNNQRRRDVLRCLVEADKALSLREIVDLIADQEKGSKKKSIYASLLQTHLPAMKKANIVSYDRRHSCIQLTELGKRCEYYMEVIDKDEIPWHLYYLTLSAFAMLLIPLAESYAFLVVTVSFFVSAVFHTKEMRKRKITLH
jgi:hypothetical protein